MPASRSRPPLPAPDVRLDAPMRARAERFAARIAAARGRREGASRAGVAGSGFEFDHYRPYRPGDDLRTLDWDVFARSEQAFVRVLRPEAGERWTILVDTSASMGVGPPGKLQRAAECALALTHVGLRDNAHVTLIDLGSGAPGTFELVRRSEAAELARWLEARHAAGRLDERGLRAQRAGLGRADQAWILSDFLDRELARWLAPAGRGTRVHWLQILGPEEIDPGERGALRWLDAESDEELSAYVDEAALAAYARELEATRERLVRTAAHRGVRLTRASSVEEFESSLGRALRV